jgi:hypothetical protein
MNEEVKRAAVVYDGCTYSVINHEDSLQRMHMVEPGPGSDRKLFGTDTE